MAEHIRFYNASYFVPTLSRCAKGGRDANSILDRDLNEENITFFLFIFFGYLEFNIFWCIEGIGKGESAINDGVRIP